VTSQPQPAPGEGKSAGQYLRQLRDVAAYVLVGATAVLLFVALIDLIPDGSGAGGRTQGSFFNFINLPTIVFPFAAVLLALLVQPRHPKAQLIVLVAVIEYAVMAFFGILFGFLIGLINLAADAGARAALEGLLVRVAWLAVFGVAAYAVYLIWRNLFYTPKPKQQPGVYGQPQYNPGAYPGQPGYQQQPPAGYQGAPGQPPAGYQPSPGQPQQQPPQNYGTGVYGQQPPPWNQSAATMPTAGGPTYPGPQGGAYPPDPTQVVPTSDPVRTQPVQPPAPLDRTQKIEDSPEHPRH
jgi:hypothetical protein